MTMVIAKKRNEQQKLRQMKQTRSPRCACSQIYHFCFLFFIPHLFPSRLCIVKHGTSNQGGCVGRCNEIYKQSNCRMCLYLGRGPSMNTLQNTWPRFSLDLQKIVYFSEALPFWPHAFICKVFFRRDLCWFHEHNSICFSFTHSISAFFPGARKYDQQGLSKACFFCRLLILLLVLLWFRFVSWISIPFFFSPSTKESCKKWPKNCQKLPKI